MHKTIKSSYKRVLSIVGQIFACFVLGVLNVFLFAAFDLARDWEEVKAANYDDVFRNQHLFRSYLSLIGFRLTLYLVPALLVASVRCFYNRNKLSRNKKKMMLGLLVDSYSLQFFTFSAILALYNLFGCDYLLGANILSKMNSFTFVIGLVAALVIDKKLPIKLIYESDETQKL